MADSGSIIRRIAGKRLVILFLLLIAGWTLWAFDELPLLDTTVTGDGYRAKGENFVVQFELDVEDSSRIELEGYTIPRGITLRSVSVRPFSKRINQEDDTDPETRHISLVTFYLLGNSYGRYILDDIEITIDGKPFHIPSVLLRIGYWSQREIVVPLELQWRIPEGALYEGQIIPMILEAVNQEDIDLFTVTRVEKPLGGIWETVPDIGSISSETVDDIELYSIPVASYFFIPTIAGTVTIPSAEAGSRIGTGTAPAISFTVAPIPEEVRNSGALGEFSFNVSTPDRVIASGEDLRLSCRLTGEGNLNFLKIPEPVIEGGALVSTDMIENYTPGLTSYRGMKQVDYVFRLENPGTYTVEVESFNWLSLETGEIESTPSWSIPITVQKGNSVDSNQSQNNPLEFQFPDADYVANADSSPFYRNFISYFLFAPGALVFLIVFIVRQNRKKRDRNQIRKNTVVTLLFLIPLLLSSAQSRNEELGNAYDTFYRVYHGENTEAAKNQLGTLLEHHPRNHGLVYARGILAYQEGDISGALLYFRSAVYLAPWKQEYRESVHRLQDWLQLEDNIPLPPILYPDIFYGGTIFFINLSWTLAVFILLGKRRFYLIVLFLCIGLTLVCLVGFLTSFSSYSKDWGISRGITGIRQIPNTRTEEWIQLEEGTSLHIIDRYNSFLLIKTDLGLQGWEEEDNVLTWPVE